MRDIEESSNRGLFKVISTFSGGGGSTLGYRIAGGKVLVCNEFVGEARNTYRANNPHTKILEGDIKDLSASDFLSAAGVSVGEIDILDGSPPCSAFSMSGKREAGWNQTKRYSDGKKIDNIEDLFFEFLRIADGIKPKVIVAENVEGLNVGEAKKYRNEIISTFKEIGYTTGVKILKASEFGVAQNRPRMFFVGVRNDIAQQVGINPFNVNKIFPAPSGKITTLGEAFVDIDLAEGQLEQAKEMVEHNVRYSWCRLLELMPVDPDTVLKGSDFHENGSFFNMYRASMKHPAPTLTASGQSQSAAGVVHPIEMRKLTIPELKRIMGLPDDFIVTGTFDQQAERIGRMVSPPVMAAISNSVYQNVLSKIL
jgi:DNA (cytosine-5)-methyltransferase 1